ncbi:hypothetical protein EDB83DRAFT_186831 [Lactarius deliciosus]|nr:hypothetical protein EDB83DRAFT_186831 [Lactarius deliciosus]
MMTLLCHLLSLPIPMRLPRPYQPHFTPSTASPMYHCLTTSTPFIRQPSKASAFPLSPRIQPPVMQYRILSPQLYHCPTPLPQRRHLPLLFPLPPYLPPFPSNTTQRRLYMHQISHLQLLVIQLSTIYFLQVRRCLYTRPSLDLTSHFLSQNPIAR